MKIKPLFPSPLVIDRPFESDAESGTLAEAIRRRAAGTPSESHSTLGGWQSAPDFLDWAGPQGIALLRHIVAICDRNTLSFADGTLTREPHDWDLTIWANLNRPGHANSVHAHPGAYWSGCFYADDGGIAGKPDLGGAIEFADPRGPMPMMYAPNVKMGIEGCVTAGLAERFFPTTGDLLIFPSWLRHQVTPYLGERERISVAFNLGF
ncbi:MAG: TIGR02466 family protein [Thalassobaculaceae bacterium]|nr:TIGR02466 family protein [Thalassobaculaceae bacterium]